jgi:aryl-alcohol dehydrogenase-like predicted oxidoreductase
MRYRELLNSDIKLSEIGLGCASYWGNKHFSEKKATAVVHQAIDSGVNYFDTGHSYSGGHAEIRLGRALKSKAAADKVQLQPLLISSKVGTRVGNYGRLYKDFSPAWIKQSCELSLRLLQVDHLPVFFLHGPNLEDFNDDVYQALTELQQQGKIGLVGVNSFNDSIIELTTNSNQFQCLMLDFNIMTPLRSKTIEKLNQQGLDVIVAGALAGGLYDRRFKQFNGLKSFWYWLRALKNNKSMMKDAKQFAFLNEQAPATAIQLALAYVLNNQKICSALVGTTSVAHLNEILQVDINQLNGELLNKIVNVQTVLNS